MTITEGPAIIDQPKYGNPAHSTAEDQDAAAPVAALILDDPVDRVAELKRELADELFFPGRGESTAEAKRICNGCPVRQECLDYALTPPFERFGIWGGLSERERRRIRRQRLHGPRQDGAA